MPKPIELTSPRLRLRRWRTQDLAPFAEMNRDPEVMRYFPALLEPAQSAALMQRIQAHFARHGYGLWALERTNSGAFIGFTGLLHVGFGAPFTPAIEIGWRLARAHQGQGLAREAAQRVLAYAFEELKLDEVVAFTPQGNQPSRRLMTAIGMQHDEAGDFEHPALSAGHPLRRHVLYRLARADWEARR